MLTWPQRRPRKSALTRSRLDVRSRESFAEFLDANDGAAADGAGEQRRNHAGRRGSPMRMMRSPTPSSTSMSRRTDRNQTGACRACSDAVPATSSTSARTSGKVPAAGLATYCASKHAVVGFSEALRDELAGTGVTVTAVLPSAVRTELTAGVKLGGLLPTVDPEDIAAAVVRRAPTAAPWSPCRPGCAPTNRAAAMPGPAARRDPRPTHPRPRTENARHHRAIRLLTNGCGASLPRRSRSARGKPPGIQGGEVGAHRVHHQVRVLGPCSASTGSAGGRGRDRTSPFRPASGSVPAGGSGHRGAVDVKGFVEVGDISVQGVRGGIRAAGPTVAAAAEPCEERVLGIRLAGLAVGRGVAPRELREQLVVRLVRGPGGRRRPR